jgi:hypothetical protein
MMNRGRGEEIEGLILTRKVNRREVERKPAR